MKHTYFIGIISYLPDDLPNLDNRIKYHKEQLRWLESLGIGFEVYRVESAWGEKAKNDPELTTSLNLHSISCGKNPPGANRNLLLKELYQSDFNWLVCFDDDRSMYPHYEPARFFKDLDYMVFTDLAMRGYMLLCLDPIYLPFKKNNYEWKYHETHWKFESVTPEGGLQICFLPNLHKFGYSELYFDETTYAQKDEPPEDYKFKLDWLIHKHPIIRCDNLIMREIGQTNGNGSTLYADLKFRREVELTQRTWLKNYLQTQFPRHPELWKKGELNRRRNPKFTKLIPRSERYVFKDSDLPK